MSFKCLFGLHSWDGCKCTKCDKTRDKEHVWDGCKCSKCGSIRNEQHAWNGCTCAICGKTKAHVYEGFECINCGKERQFSKFTDSRDGHVYKCVKIGNQIWMAENLQFRPKDGHFFHYENHDTDYGCYYNFETALQIAPNGWHLPNEEEWNTLSNHLGGDKVAGKKMKTTKGWWSMSWDGNGTNTSGFSGLPSGYRDSSGRSGGFLEECAFWVAPEISSESSKGRYRGLTIQYDDLNDASISNDLFINVRCIKDNETSISSTDALKEDEDNKNNDKTKNRKTSEEGKSVIKKMMEELSVVKNSSVEYLTHWAEMQHKKLDFKGNLEDTIKYLEKKNKTIIDQMMATGSFKSVELNYQFRKYYGLINFESGAIKGGEGDMTIDIIFTRTWKNNEVTAFVNHIIKIGDDIYQTTCE